MDPKEDHVLEVTNLRVTFPTLHGETQAVRGIDFSMRRGRTLALVGESGSGKSVTSYAILRLIRPPGRIASGSIKFNSQSGESIDLAALNERDDRLYRVRGGKIGMVFQEPMTALSPVHTIEDQLTEAVLLHKKVTKKAAVAKALEMMDRVGITDPTRRLKQYPFEFSGGMRQRVVIAMAMICEPEVLIADEPTTALDVTVQAQILTLISNLQKDMGTSVLFITHDLGVVAQVADDVAVMRFGRILERAPVRDIYRSPLHPYTRELLNAVPHPQNTRAAFSNATIDVPAGWQLEEPSGNHATPRMHNVPGGRELLLWPSQNGVMR